MSSSRRPGRPAANDPAPPDDDALLDAVLDAFAERGFDGTSVRELARELGVSHNLLPQRFGTKAQLWHRAVDHGFESLAADLARLALDQPDDDLDRLRAMIVAFVERNAARPALLRIISQEAVRPTERLDYVFEHYIDPVAQAGALLLGRLHAAGRVRTDSVADLYFLMTHGAGGPLSLPALADRFGAPVDPQDPEAIRRHAERMADLIFEGLTS